MTSPEWFTLIFFLYGSDDHRDLHSFPTRRSSDLELQPGARRGVKREKSLRLRECHRRQQRQGTPGVAAGGGTRDRKSTRLNSSHVEISYAVFCLKKKRRNGM